jgi:hypothetical protein
MIVGNLLGAFCHFRSILSHGIFKEPNPILLITMLIKAIDQSYLKESRQTVTTFSIFDTLFSSLYNIIMNKGKR